MKTNQDREREKKWKYNIWNSWKTSWNLVQDVFRIIIYRILSFRFFFASFFLIRCVRLCALRLACEFAVEWQRKQIVQWLFLNELRTIFIIIFFLFGKFYNGNEFEASFVSAHSLFFKTKETKNSFRKSPDRISHLMKSRRSDQRVEKTTFVHIGQHPLCAISLVHKISNVRKLLRTVWLDVHSKII